MSEELVVQERMPLKSFEKQANRKVLKYRLFYWLITFLILLFTWGYVREIRMTFDAVAVLDFDGSVYYFYGINIAILFNITSSFFVNIYHRLVVSSLVQHQAYLRTFDSAK